MIVFLSYHHIIFIIYFEINIIEMKINIKIKGMRTKNHETPGAPARQMRLRTHVQNNT